MTHRLRRNVVAEDAKKPIEGDQGGVDIFMLQQMLVKPGKLLTEQLAEDALVGLIGINSSKKIVYICDIGKSYNKYKRVSWQSRLK